MVDTIHASPAASFKVTWPGAYLIPR